MRPRLRIEKKAKQRKSSTLEDPIIKEIETSEGLNLGLNRTKESKSPNGEKGKCVTSVDVNTLTHTEALRAHVLDVVTCVTRLPIAQRPHGTTRALLRDPE